MVERTAHSTRQKTRSTQDMMQIRDKIAEPGKLAEWSRPPRHALCTNTSSLVRSPLVNLRHQCRIVVDSDSTSSWLHGVQETWRIYSLSTPPTGKAAAQSPRNLERPRREVCTRRVTSGDFRRSGRRPYRGSSELPSGEALEPPASH